jgi:hypothetical protein
MTKKAAIDLLKRSENRSPTFNKKDALTYLNVPFLGREVDVVAGFNNDALSTVTLTSNVMCWDEAISDRKTYDDALAQKYKALGSTTGPTDYVDGDTLVTVSIKPLGMPPFPQEPTPPPERASLYNILFLQYKQKMQEWLAGMEHVRLLRERCSSLGGSTASIEVRYQSASDAQRVRAATAEEQERLRRRQQSDRDKM